MFLSCQIPKQIFKHKTFSFHQYLNNFFISFNIEARFEAFAESADKMRFGKERDDDDVKPFKPPGNAALKSI